jgi:ABC-type multidrug transport system fused ATPase/permease subunit
MKLKYYWKLIKHIYSVSPYHVIASDFALIAMTAVEMYAINYGGKFIDALSQYLGQNIAFDLQQFYYSDAFWYLCLTLLLAIASLLLSNLRTYLLDFIDRRSSFNAWSVLFDKLASENLQEIESKRFQDLLAFVNSYSIGSLTTTYLSFAEGTKQLIRAVTAMAIMISHVGWSPLLIIIFVLPQAYFDHVRRKEQGDFRFNQVEKIKLMKYLEQFSQDLNNFIEIKVNRIFPFLKSEYNGESGEFMNKILGKVKYQAIEKSMYGVLGLTLTRVYYIFLVMFSIITKLTIGTLSALIGYTTTIYESLLSFFTNLFIFLNNYVYFSKFFEFEEYTGFGDLSKGIIKLKHNTPHLELEKVNYLYQEREQKTLVNLNLEVKPGEKVAIIGGDASGKSTLVKIICGLYELTGGKYLINSHPLQDLARGELKSRMAVVTQNFNKYYFTVRQNIILAKNDSKINQNLYDEVKDIAGVDDFMKRIHLSDDQVLGKLFVHGREISPGLWQRLSIARALYRNKDVLLLDEPFSYIDEDSRRVILKKIFKYMGKDKSVIYISQSSENTEMFDKIYYLKSGRLVQVK